MKLRINKKYKPAYVLLLVFWGLLPLFAAGQNRDVPLDAEDIDSSEAEAPAFLKKMLEDIEAEKKGKKSVDIEIDGLIVDETVTKMGRDFYDIFYSNWEAPPNSSNFTLEITEKPMIGMGTRIMVEINDQLVVESPLQPRYDVIESIAKQAVLVCYDYLLNYEQIQRELSGEDLSGSGIY